MMVQWACRSAGEKLDLDAERQIRSPEEMAAEAAQLAVYLNSNLG
jgi:hypothetical protein